MKLISEVEFTMDDGFGSSETERVELVFERPPDDTDRNEIRKSFDTFISDMYGEYQCTYWEDECYFCHGRDGKHNANCHEDPDFNPECLFPSSPEKS
jgi:hypothetical protein